MKRCIVLSLLLLPVGCRANVEQAETASRTVAAQRGPVEATAVVSPAEPKAGERLTLTVTVEAAASVAVTTPLITVEDDAIGQFNVLDQTSQPDLPLPAGRRMWTQNLVLDTFATGDVELPPLHVAFTDNRGTPAIEGFLTLPAIDLSVTSQLLEGETELRAMRTDRPLPVAPLSMWWWLLIPAVIGVGIATLMWSRRGSVTSRIPLTPAQRARLDLSSLDLNEEGAFARVADIVRAYLEDAFDLRAPRATTHEFLRVAQHSSVLSQPNRATLQELLLVADLVKFARHLPATDAPSKAMHSALAFVDDTAPTEADELEIGAPA